jgi:MAF protein
MPNEPRDNPELILASGSPRRNELIALTGWKVEVRPVNVDETELPGEDGRTLARRLAETKALEAAERFGTRTFIIAADTVVESAGEILGKPASNKEAGEMLLKLRGKPHLVHTAIAVFDPNTNEPYIDACTTEVPMRDYSQAEVTGYVETGSPLDKAGAYGIQDESFNPVQVEEITGCYANVVGLPVCHVVRAMRRFGIQPFFDVPSRCKAHTGYDCEVYPQILRDEI